MSRNRKSQSAGSRFGPALKAILLCLLIGGSGVGYVWQKEQITRLGQQIKGKEVELKRIEDQNEKLRKQLATMRGPQFLELEIKKLNLGLAQPQPGQVIKLSEPTAEVPRPEPERQIAARAHDPANLQ